MKKILPKTKYNTSGFTLIELLVVIAIIAVLAVMGFAVFNGLTGRGNDARRSADVKAIADAYETKRTSTMADYGGLVLAATDFATGIIPADPIAAKAYCIRTGTGAIGIANATVSSTDGVDGTGCHGANWTAVSATALTAGSTFFKVCAANQANSATICSGSKQ